MSSLAETQSAVRAAICDGNAAAVLPHLTGGSDPAHRLSIHQRHFAASIVRVLRGRFPALEWLIGSQAIVMAATTFARRHPPTRPCLAEYGEDFPAFLGERQNTTPWLGAVGTLEWRVGAVSVAVDRPAIALDALAAFDSVKLEDLRLRLQPGLAYMSAAWPVDNLLRLHLAGTAPEQLVFAPHDVWLEVRGARGAFTVNRLDRAAHAFRSAIAEGATLAAAVAGGQTSDTGFDPGSALAALFTDSLVTGVATGAGEEHAQ